MAAADGAWLCFLSAIQSSWMKRSGRFTSAPIDGRSMNCGPLPSPGSTVTPLRFQSSGIPSPVDEASSKIHVTSALLPPPPERLDVNVSGTDWS